MEKKDKSEHRSTARALDVLEFVSKSSQGYSLTQLAEETDAPKSSLFPIVHTLKDRGFLLYDELTALYTIGPVAYQVGASFLNNGDAEKLIEKEMDNIVEQCSETVHYGRLVDGNVLYILKKDSPQAIRMTSRTGSTLPAYGAAIGKALLLDYNEKELKELYPDGLCQLTTNTITSFDELSRQLEKYRKDDITYECEESNYDIRCVGVALRKQGKVHGALSIAFPIFRCSEEKIEKARELLLQSKKKIEKMFL